MNKNLTIRIIADIILAFAVIQGWWFIALPLGLVGAWLFPYYIEILMAGIAYDSLFGMVPDIGIKGYVGTIVAMIALLIVSGSKRLVRR